MLKATNIKWDTDGDMDVFNKLPTEIIIPENLSELYKVDKEYAIEEISDWLSEETEFCHDGFEVTKEITIESVKNELYDFFNDKMISGEAPEIKNVGLLYATLAVDDDEIAIDCVNGKQIRLIIQVD